VRRAGRRRPESAHKGLALEAGDLRPMAVSAAPMDELDDHLPAGWAGILSALRALCGNPGRGRHVVDRPADLSARGRRTDHSGRDDEIPVRGTREIRLRDRRRP